MRKVLKKASTLRISSFERTSSDSFFRWNLTYIGVSTKLTTKTVTILHGEDAVRLRFKFKRLYFWRPIYVDV